MAFSSSNPTARPTSLSSRRRRGAREGSCHQPSHQHLDCLSLGEACGPSQPVTSSPQDCTIWCDFHSFFFLLFDSPERYERRCDSGGDPPRRWDVRAATGLASARGANGPLHGGHEDLEGGRGHLTRFPRPGPRRRGSYPHDATFRLEGLDGVRGLVAFFFFFWGGGPRPAARCTRASQKQERPVAPPS